MRNAATFLEVADWLPDPLLVVRRDATIVAANRAAVRLLDVPATPLSGALLTDRAPEGPAPIERYLRQCARTRGPLPGRLVLRGRDGAAVECRCNGGLFHEQSHDGPPLVLLRVVPRDAAVSEFRRLDARLAEVRQELETLRAAEQERRRSEARILQAQKMESIGVLAGGIAHDFNNLLTSVMGFVDLAREELDGSHAPAVRECLDMAMAGTTRAAELVQQVLAYAGQGRFVVESIDLSTLVRDICRLLEVSISRKATLHYRLPDDLPPIAADVTQLRQVVMNLVINASEALDERPGLVTVTTMLRDHDDAADATLAGEPPAAAGPYVVLEVADTGRGMSAEVQQRIFDPFYTTKFTGRGLGLAAVLGVVRGHGGTIRVRSYEGIGTTMRVLLPVTPTAAPPVAPDAPAAAGWRGHGDVLVVDDDAAIRGLVRRQLERCGFRVVLAADGRDALDRFAAAPDAWTLVLLDMTMPRLDGAETLAELQRRRPGVPVILMSGYDLQSTAARLADDGAAAFLAKPFTAERLVATVRSVLTSTAGT